MKQHWEKVLELVHQGQAEHALQAIKSFEDLFGEEVSVSDSKFQSPLLQIKCLLLFQTNDYKQSAETAALFLDRFSDTKKFKAFITYIKGLAEFCSGELSAAKDSWNLFIEEHSELPEVSLVKYYLGLLHLQLKDSESALAAFNTVISTDGSDAQKILGQISKVHIVQIFLETESVEEASNTLLSIESPSLFPIIQCWKSYYSNLLLKELALQEQRAAESYDSLVTSLRPPAFIQQQLSAIMSKWKNRNYNQSLMGRRLHWRMPMASNAHQCEQSITRWQSLLPSTIEWYSDVFSIYSSFDDNFRIRSLSKAIISSDDSKIKEALLTKAFTSLIDTLLKNGHHAEAKEYIDHFLSSFPQSVHLPKFLFRQAKLLLAKKLYSEAIDKLILLINHFNRESDLNIWKLTLGKAYRNNNDHEASVSVLKELLDSSPNSNWIPIYQIELITSLLKMKRYASVLQISISVLNDPNIQSGYKEVAAYQRLLAAIRLEQSNVVESTFNTYTELNYISGRKWDIFNTMGLWHDTHQTGESDNFFLEVMENGNFDQANFAASRLGISSHGSKRNYAHGRDWFSLSIKHRRCPSIDAVSYLTKCPMTTSDINELSELFQSSINNFKSAKMFESYYSMMDWITKNDSSSLFEEPIAISDFKTKDAYIADPIHVSRRIEWEARQLVRENRINSADEMRLRSIDQIDPNNIDASALAACIETATKWDLPSNEILCETFIRDFENHLKMPVVLLHYGRRKIREKQKSEATKALSRIIQSWPVSNEAELAGIELAELALEDKNISECSEILSSILRNPSLIAQNTAKALQIKLGLQLLENQPKKAYLTWKRLAVTYRAQKNIIKESTETYLQFLKNNSLHDLYNESVSLAKSLGVDYSIRQT